MKYLKLYESFNDIDPFDEEDWDETEPDDTFLYWLKENYPDDSKWNEMTYIDCSHNQLTSLKGIENLNNLTHLYCFNNQLTSLNGIEYLKNLNYLYCSNNHFSKDYKKFLKSLKIRHLRI